MQQRKDKAGFAEAVLYSLIHGRPLASQWMTCSFYPNHTPQSQFQTQLCALIYTRTNSLYDIDILLMGDKQVVSSNASTSTSCKLKATA